MGEESNKMGPERHPDPSRLPTIFAEIADDDFHPLIEEELDKGTIPIGTTCSYIPESLLSVDGLWPIRIRGGDTRGTPMADTYLSNVLCSYVRSVLEQVLEGRMEHLRGWVFAASCDHTRRLYDNLVYLSPPEFVHMVDVPHKRDAEAVAWMARELKELARKLSDAFEVDTGDVALTTAINQCNEVLGMLAEIGRTRKHVQPPISGTVFHQMMVASMTLPKKVLLPALKEVLAITHKTPDEHRHRARLLVMGSQLDDYRLIQLIESLGGLVVADRFCTGSIPGLKRVEFDDDPWVSLAFHSLNRMSCPRMMGDFAGRLEEVVRTAEDFRVDGVVLQIMKFCDLWGVESSAMTQALRERSIPVLRLEREAAWAGEGQIRTRVQAFLESIAK